MVWFLLDLWLMACLVSLLIMPVVACLGRQKPRDPKDNRHAAIGDSIQRQFY